MDIWDFSQISSAKDHTESIQKLIVEEAEKLSKFTKGKVVAEFAIIQRYSGIKAMAEFVSSVAKPSEIISYPQSDDLKDANILYQIYNYGFEIHNDVYRFRLFEIKMSPDFPVEIWVDSDIFHDEVKSFKTMGIVQESNSKIIVSNEADFVDCFQLMLNNRKVAYIVAKMIATSSAGE